MDKEVMISVIMGVYRIADRKEIVYKSIKSILNQTYSDFEFVICDDGSDDDSYQIIREMVKEDKRCIVIKKDTNGGLASALNECIKCARGKYIARMDDDDISHLNRFEKQTDFLEKNVEYALVGSSVRLIGPEGVWGIRNCKERPCKKDFLKGTQFIHPTVMMRREMLVGVGGYCTEKTMRLAEDYDLFMRMYAAGHKGYNLQEALFDYREDNNAYKRRTYKRRLEEVSVRLRGFKLLGLYPLGYAYALKPLIVGLVPQRILKHFR